MTELSQLQERVTAIEELFRASSDVVRRRSEQLAQLTATIEESFVDRQELVQSLRDELARAQEDHQQLRAMLDSLLDAAGGASVSQCELEARLSNLIEAASSMGVGRDPGDIGRAKGPERSSHKEPEHQTSEQAESAPEVSSGGEEEPLELTQMILKDGSVADVKDQPSSPASSRRALELMRRAVAKREPD